MQNKGIKKYLAVFERKHLFGAIVFKQSFSSLNCGEKYRFSFMLLVSSIIASKQQIPHVHFFKNLNLTVRTSVIILHNL